VKRLAVLALLALPLACTTRGGEPPPLWGDQPAEPLDLRGELSAKEVPLLGDVELRLDLYAAQGTEVEFTPAIPDGFVGTVEAAAPRPFGDGEWRRYLLHLRPTRTGELTIPAFTVPAKGEEESEGEDAVAATTPEWTLSVGSVLADRGSELEAPAPPFPPRASTWPWLGGAAAALVLGALVWWWRRRRPRQRDVLETPLPPHVKALRALTRLKGAPRGTAEQVDAFYVEVSHVLRVYLEERFGMHAPERTTEEFLVELESDARLSPEQRGRLREFLAQCDLVKFARMMPPEAVHARTLETAEQLVEATRADLVREGAA
jgi:hypothetical protein